ncbi:MAG: hypothetical protein ACE3JQ_01615 [Paenisporosarcina sp.]
MFPLVLRELIVNDAVAILNCFSNVDVLRYYGQSPNSHENKKTLKIHNKA